MSVLSTSAHHRHLLIRPLLPNWSFKAGYDTIPPMNNFHDQKLWQDAFVVLMEVHDTFDDMREGENEEIVEDVIRSATEVAAKIADGLSRADRRFGRQVLLDAIGMVAMVRTHLAVSWGRGLVTDELFKSMDDKYASLTENLQRAR